MSGRWPPAGAAPGVMGAVPPAAAAAQVRFQSAEVGWALTRPCLAALSGPCDVLFGRAHIPSDLSTVARLELIGQEHGRITRTQHAARAAVSVISKRSLSVSADYVVTSIPCPMFCFGLHAGGQLVADNLSKRGAGSSPAARSLRLRRCGGGDRARASPAASPQRHAPQRAAPQFWCEFGLCVRQGGCSTSCTQHTQAGNLNACISRLPSQTAR